jgi:hypothetical protein
MGKWTHENDFDDLVQAASVQYGIPVPVIKGLIATESGFRADASKGESGGRTSAGLTQLLLGTAQGLGYSGPLGSPDDLSGLYDPETNIDLGVQYLGQQYGRAGSWWGAYSAYNGGWNPARAMGVPATADILPLKVIVNSLPLTYRDVALGEYGNQPAVDRFTANVRYFQGLTPSPGAPFVDGGGTSAPLVLALVGAAVLGYLLTMRR